MIFRTFTRNLLRTHRAPTTKPLDITVCIDIECTCDSPVQIYPMEVIEIACLKLDLTEIPTVNTSKRKSTSSSHIERNPTFHSYVKPVINPQLTLFCQELTGVFQTTVDKSELICPVIDRLFDWLRKQDLIDDKYVMKKQFAFASCGNFDLNMLSPIIKECKFKNDLELPIYFREWINVKKTFVNHKKEWPKGLYHMLEVLNEEPSGRLHSARDDCKNLARIIECLHADGCKFHVTSRSEHHSNNNNVNNRT